MTVEEQVYAILAAASGVTVLCPAARIFVPGDQQNVARPYIIHFPVSVTPIRSESGLMAMAIWDFYQVSCIADTYSAARALARAVIAALDGVHSSGLTAFYESEAVLSDPETRTQQIALNFRIGFAQS